MKTQFYISGLLSLCVLLFVQPVAGQDNEPAPPSAKDVEASAPVEPETPASQEVEINEDNYRQFMELKDANLQREVIPENAFKPGSGLQKLEKLPEESQKHLRNELREIIVQGNPWQPGDEQGDFPYTPSAAAANNPGLEKQEREAWGELVDSYNQREAQIYANSAGTQAARRTEDGTGARPGNGQQSGGDGGQTSEGNSGQPSTGERKPGQSDSEGTYSPGASSDPNAGSTAGVSQNAMEFLQGLGQGGSNTEGSTGANSTESGAQGTSPASAGTAAQAQTGQQARAGQNSADTGSSPTRTQEPNAASTSGVSQNAMDFLKGSAGQSEAGSEDGTAASQADPSQGETQADEQVMAQADGQQNGQDGAQAESQAGEQGDGQASGQEQGQSQEGPQTENAQAAATPVPSPETTPVSSPVPEEESTAGASQNALEYLTGETVPATGSTGDEPSTGQPAGTLTIQDLLNAQGVGGTTGAAPAPTIPADKKQADEKAPEKDSGGY
jgi:hypothetical protein